jgi:hypothetical protein
MRVQRQKPNLVLTEEQRGVLTRVSSSVSFRQACMTSAEPGRYRQCPWTDHGGQTDEAWIAKRPSE